MKQKTKKGYSPLGDAPKELILQITEEMELKDKLSLSSTCWNLRLLVSPDFFGTLTLKNTDQSGAVAKGLAASKANEVVKTLWFEGSAPTDKSEDYADVSNIMPNSVHFVLANLNKFPNLEKVSIGFNFQMDHDSWKVCVLCLPACTDVSTALASESEKAWHYLMAKTFEALIGNKNSGGIKDLQIRDLFPRDISPFWNKGWQELLQTVEKFDLSLWGHARGNHHNELATTKGYMKWVKDLDWVFFLRLTNLTELSFTATRYGMLIGQSMASVLFDDLHLPLGGNQMRRLKKLTLGNIFLTIELIDFLLGHIATLESLTFTECAAYIEAAGTNRKGPTWAEMLDSLVDARAPRLKHISIESAELSTIKEIAQRAEDDDVSDVEDGSKESCEKLAKLAEKKPVKIVFPYAHLDDQGKHVGSWNFVLEHYKSGKDQQAYEKLAGLVIANAMEMPWRMERLSAKYGQSWTMTSSRAAALQHNTDRT